MQEPYIRISPSRLQPFLLTCEHARAALPPDVRPTAGDRAALRTHWGWDPGAWELTRETARCLGASAVGGRWSRLYVDLNRPPHDATLVRAAVEGRPLSFNRGADPAEIARRLAAVWVPYHAEVDRAIGRLVVHGLRPVLLAVHTYTPRWNGRARDFEAGVLYDACGAASRRLAAALRDAGLRVRYNEPYSGRRGLMYSIDRHGRHHGLPHLELEINQGLFERPGTAQRLAPYVARAMREIGA